MYTGEWWDWLPAPTCQKFGASKKFQLLNDWESTKWVVLNTHLWFQSLVMVFHHSIFPQNTKIHPEILLTPYVPATYPLLSDMFDVCFHCFCYTDETKRPLLLLSKWSKWRTPSGLVQIRRSASRCGTAQVQKDHRCGWHFNVSRREVSGECHIHFDLTVISKLANVERLVFLCLVFSWNLEYVSQVSEQEWIK